MVSLLGEWNYKFPKPIPLTKTMKDYLEDEVDESIILTRQGKQTHSAAYGERTVTKNTEISYCLMLIIERHDSRKLY